MKNRFINNKSIESLTAQIDLMASDVFGATLGDKSKGLGISISTLSDFFSNKHIPSHKTITKILKQLELSDIEYEYALTLIQTKQHRRQDHAKARFNKLQKETDYIKLPSDIVDIKLFSIFEYLKIQSNAKDIKSLCENFKLSTDELESLLSPLVERKLVRKQRESYYATKKNITFHDKEGSKKIQQFHKNMLKKGIEAIELPVVKREFSTNYIKVKPTDLDKMKEEIIEFRRLLQQKYYYNESKDSSLYALNIQFFEIGDYL